MKKRTHDFGALIARAMPMTSGAMGIAR